MIILGTKSDQTRENKNYFNAGQGDLQNMDNGRERYLSVNI